MTVTDQLLGHANNSPLIVGDPADSRFVAVANRLDAPSYGCSLQVSADRGLTWTGSSPVPKLPEGVDECYAPEAAFGKGGRLFYLFAGLAGQGHHPAGIFLTSSTDGARTFRAPQRVLAGEVFGVRMAVDPGDGSQERIHLIWLKPSVPTMTGGFGHGANQIFSSHSDDSGLTWSEPVLVSDPARERVVAPALSLGPDHRVYVAYLDLRRDAVDFEGLDGPVWDEPWSLLLARSDDGGRTFGAASVADRWILPAERVMAIFTMPAPSLSVRVSTVCLAWTEGRSGDDDAMARCSQDKGRSWHRLVRLNDDLQGNGKRQYLPAIAIAPSGRVDAAFLDRRDDLENRYNNVYYTFSQDGGRRFSPNLRLSRVASDSRIGQRYGIVSAAGQVETGGRLGLLAGDSESVVAWPDTRFAGAGPKTAQEIFAAVVAVNGIHGVFPWLVAAFVAVAAAAAASRPVRVRLERGRA